MTRIRNLERMREISEVAVRHGFGYFFERHPVFSVLLRRKRRRQSLPAQRGRHIKEMLEELGPTFIKFGQLLSTRPDIIPEDIVVELVKLQDRVAPFPFEVAREVIEEELDLTLQRAFESFDPEPVASASIGQVYGATLPGGILVIVKVQRPNAAKQIRKDIDLMMQFAQMAEGRVALGFSPLAVVEEFSRSINRELDYVLEARNAERFAANFHDSENVAIPAIYWRYCTNRVLTMERLDGPTLNTEVVAQLSLEEKRALAETVADCWFRQILKDGFFHADPHPANIVYLGEGKIGLFDFGLAGLLRAEDLAHGVTLFLRVMDSDIPGIKRSLRRLGVQWNPSADEVVSQTIEDAFGRYFGRSLSNIDVKSLLDQAFDIVYSLKLRLPSRFLLLDKALLTMEGVVGSLYPDMNLFRFAAQYTGDLRKDRLDPRSVSDRITREALAYAEIVRDFPHQIYSLVEKMHSGELEIRYRHTGLEDMIHRLDVITNRMVVALVAIALGAVSTAVGILVEGGPHVAGLSVWGLPGFAGSLFFGVWLIWSIIRSGRL
jgi:ubiquinone biosynthesis protein